ncbi:MAG: hypothetical protein WDA42_06695 [Candidatus Bathyarchaeia archaeon]
MSYSSETADKFFGLSEAYFSAAEELARRYAIEHLQEPNYIGSACMFNARLGVELFLKGMIVLRDPSAKVGTHVLEKLAPVFVGLYPESECAWSVPFTVQVIGGTEDERSTAVEELIKNRPLDQVFRYPTNNAGQPWELVTNFNFSWFVQFLSGIIQDIKRIKVGAGVAA